MTKKIKISKKDLKKISGGTTQPLTAFELGVQVGSGHSLTLNQEKRYKKLQATNSNASARYKEGKSIGTGMEYEVLEYSEKNN